MDVFTKSRRVFRSGENTMLALSIGWLSKIWVFFLVGTRGQQELCPGKEDLKPDPPQNSPVSPFSQAEAPCDFAFPISSWPLTPSMSHLAMEEL